MPDERVPQRIGRYEIVGRLAAGGMAEVFLGRLCGPHGFERPVVIKRILPHLAVDSDIVGMFLDEARIIASLRHPNLLHVHELGREGQDLFIAMEFLEGESLSGLCRRLAKQGELLDFNLAAHIVSEACSGLHAAHEATSADGRSLQIVHRDVSPENIFVTYAGAVHVIDFGIATTVDRIGRTQAGTVRGKLAYISPEHLHSLALDRRADIFGLGVVLFELASGRRAYKRDSPAQTMMAVMAEPPPNLCTHRPDAPERLQAICSRAMAKHRRERFQTAADLRRELLGFIRKHAEGDPGEELGVLMRRLFADRMAEKAEMLGRVRQGAHVEILPAEVDVHVELPTAEQQPTAALTGLSQAMPIAQPSGSPRRHWVPAAVLLTILAGGGALIGSRALQAGAQDATAGRSVDLAAAVADDAVLTPSAAVPRRDPSPPVTSAAPTAIGLPSATPSPQPRPIKQRSAAPIRPSASAASVTKPSPTVW